MTAKLPLEKELEPIFLQKFPPFSENVKEFIAKYGPYFILIIALLGVFGLVTALGVGSTALGFGAVPAGIGFNFYLSIVIGAGMLIIYLMSFSPLRARRRAGWNLLYYALLLGLLSNLIQLSILGTLITGLLGFWVLFQIREKYH